MPKTAVKPKTAKKSKNLGQIRLTKTPEIEEVLEYLRGHLKLLNEAEILKFTLSKVYREYLDNRNQGKDAFLGNIKSLQEREMHPQGRKWLIEKGIDPDMVSDEEILDLLYEDDKKDRGSL